MPSFGDGRVSALARSGSATRAADGYARADRRETHALDDTKGHRLAAVATDGYRRPLDHRHPGKAVFNDLTLITPFQIVLNGYHRITALVGAIFEPAIRPIVDWANSRFNWHLCLQSHWRPLFMLSMVATTPHSRALWREGLRRDAIFFGVATTLLAIIWSALLGVLPTHLSDGVVVASSALEVAIGAAALLVIGGFYFRRIALNVLGGFIAAGLILLSNWVVIALS